MATLLVFAFFASAVALTVFFAKRPRKCSCQTAKAVMKEIQDRKLNAKKAENYNPKTVDPDKLPIVKK